MTTPRARVRVLHAEKIEELFPEGSLLIERPRAEARLHPLHRAVRKLTGLRHVAQVFVSRDRSGTEGFVVDRPVQGWPAAGLDARRHQVAHAFMVPGSQPASPNPFGAKAGGRAHVLVRRRIGNGMVIELTGRSALLISGAILAASYLIAAVLTGSAATPRSDAFRPNFDPAGVVILMPPEAPTPRPTRPPERPARPPVPLSTTDLQAL